MIRFEWDDAKAATNLRKHGISFEQAKAAFADMNAIEWIDDSENYEEERIVRLALCQGTVLFVVSVERNGRIRLISARKANKREQETYHRQET